MKTDRRRLVTGCPALLATVAMGVNSGAANQVAPAARVKGDGGTLRLLVNMSGTQSFPPYVIQKRRLDKKYGFTLQAIPSTSTQTTTIGFQSGAAELGIYGWNDLSRVRNGGVKITGIAPFLGWANTIVVPIDSRIKTLGDLKGRRVGVYSRTGLDWVVMRTVATKYHNLDLEKDIVIQEGAVSLLRGLMEQDKLDATQMFNDLTAPMEVSGKFKVLYTIKTLVEKLGLPDTPCLIYAVSTDYADKHAENVKAFLYAYREAIDILKEDDGIWAEHGRDLNMTDPAVVAKLRDLAEPMLMKTFSPMTEANIRKMWSILTATAGAEQLGGATLAEGFMTFQYQ